MRKLLSLIVVVVLVAACLPMIAGASNDQAEIYINGKKINQAVPPYIEGKQVYLSAEMLAQLLEAEYAWNHERTTLSIKQQALDLQILVGERSFKLNSRLHSLGAEPFWDGEQLMVPINELSSVLGFKYIWDKLTHSLFIYKKNRFVQEFDPVLPGDFLLPPAANQADIVYLNGDQVVIQTNQSAKPRHFYLKDATPYRIVLDYPITAFADERGQIDESRLRGEVSAESSLIDKVRYAIHTQQTIRFVIELNKDVQYTITQSSDGLATVIMTNLKQKVYRVVIDPGHGGRDPGATGYSGRYEKHFNLEVSHKVVDLLMEEANIQPYMTRWDDSYITLDDRAAIANNLQADLFISIHGNTFTRPISGTETYYYNKKSENVARIMHKHVLNATKMPDRQVREANFKVLRLTQMPSVLLELGYLSTEADEAYMLTDVFQEQVARAIVAAIKEILH